MTQQPITSFDKVTSLLLDIDSTDSDALKKACGTVTLAKNCEEDVGSDQSTEDDADPASTRTTPRTETDASEDDGCWSLGILPAPCEHCFIFDWDDTLLPLAWLQQEHQKLRYRQQQQQRQQGFPSEDEQLEGKGQEQADSELLREASERAAATLRAARVMGKVVIVTNAEEGWVQHSVRKHVPALLGAVEGLEVVSARTAYEQDHPGAPSEWKRLAFERVVDDFLHGMDDGKWANFISLGDQVWERNALFAATDKVPGCWSKAVKLLERPSLPIFIKQHKALAEGLTVVVESRGNLDLSFEKGELVS